MAQTMNDLAAECGTTPRAIRKFARSLVRLNGGVIGKDSPGKGKRYALDSREFAALKKAYLQHVASQPKDSTTSESAVKSA
jgi:hypothetical protein